MLGSNMCLPKPDRMPMATYEVRVIVRELPGASNTLLYMVQYYSSWK